MRNHHALVAVAALVAATLAACGGGPDGTTAPPPGRASTGDAAVRALDPDRQAPAAPLDGATAGGTVTVWSEYNSDPFLTLDPSNSYWQSTASVLSGLVTRSLTQYVYDPEQATMVLVPDIATDLGTPNADFTHWTFTIREGVRYENGTEVTADDVAYGIKRSFDRTAFPNGQPFSNDFLLDGDTYKGPYISGTSYPGVSVDGNTLTVTAERPFPDMPYLAAISTIGPIPERGSDPATYGEHPLATGPYKVGEYTPGKSVTLVRNKEWDPDTDPGRHAYPDRYEFDFTVPADRIDATILGSSERAKTIVSIDNRSPSDYPRAQKLDRFTLGSQPCTSMLLPDYRKITDIRVRQAIGYAFPYEEAARILSESTGETSSAGTSLLPPSFPGRRDYRVLETEPGRTDPAQARALLKQAGYGPGEYELAILVDPGSSIFAEQKNLFEQSLEAAGFQVTLRSTPEHEEYLRVRDDPDAPINVRLLGWCSDWPTGSSWFPPLFESGGSFNLAHFAEPAVDAEIDRISRLPLGEQAPAWGALDETLMTDYYPAIITSYPEVSMLHGSKIAGMNFEGVYSMPTWKDIYVLQ